jgi:hypothetical protein
MISVSIDTSSGWPVWSAWQLIAAISAPNRPTQRYSPI